MHPPPCDGPVDFTEITQKTHPDYHYAKNVCATCPMFDSCRKFALRFDVAGFTAGMLPAERAAIRAAHHIKPNDYSFLDLLTPQQVTPELLEEELVYTSQKLPVALIRLVRFWSDLGETAEEIAARLPQVDINGYPTRLGYGKPKFTDRTVTWVRETGRAS